MSPAEFVPIAESSGVILLRGRWVMREACRQMKPWVDSGIAQAVIAVNISCLQFKTPRELESDIGVTLAETGLPPQYLELELTETALMDVSREHNDVIERFHHRGIRLAIDDFGTGYSSLDYLHPYPVDRLKIAQVFVTDLVAGRGAAAIVKAAIGLARELKINVIAEGIETPEQAELLRGWGCREGQGFYFSKPLLAKEVEPMLRCCARTTSPILRRSAKWQCGPGMVLRCGLSGIPHPCELDENCGPALLFAIAPPVIAKVRHRSTLNG
jgi:EAL domain-containing protein (putative c-di-GMP-specific phosphodiesterase class I)